MNYYLQKKYYHYYGLCFKLSKPTTPLIITTNDLIIERLEILNSFRIITKKKYSCTSISFRDDLTLKHFTITYDEYIVHKYIEFFGSLPSRPTEYVEETFSNYIKEKNLKANVKRMKKDIESRMEMFRLTEKL